MASPSTITYHGVSYHNKGGGCLVLEPWGLSYTPGNKNGQDPRGDDGQKIKLSWADVAKLSINKSDSGSKVKLLTKEDEEYIFKMANRDDFEHIREDIANRLFSKEPFSNPLKSCEHQALFGGTEGLLSLAPEAISFKTTTHAPHLPNLFFAWEEIEKLRVRKVNGGQMKLKFFPLGEGMSPRPPIIFSTFDLESLEQLSGEAAYYLAATKNRIVGPVLNGNEGEAEEGGTESLQARTIEKTEPEKKTNENGVVSVMAEGIPGVKVGVGLHAIRNEGVIVGYIRPTSIFAGTNLRVGMKILAINGCDCTDKSLEQVGILLRSSVGIINIVAK